MGTKPEFTKPKLSWNHEAEAEALIFWNRELEAEALSLALKASASWSQSRSRSSFIPMSESLIALIIVHV